MSLNSEETLPTALKYAGAYAIALTPLVNYFSTLVAVEWGNECTPYGISNLGYPLHQKSPTTIFNIAYIDFGSSTASIEKTMSRKAPAA